MQQPTEMQPLIEIVDESEDELRNIRTRFVELDNSEDENTEK